MSDGPHRSLPMRRGWKMVAERADKAAFESAEVCAAIVYALEDDCRSEMPQEFVRGLRNVCADQEGRLFKQDVVPCLETLREEAGSGFGRVVLEHAIREAASGSTGMTIAEKAVNLALIDRAARCSRQVEEHYCRESSMPRANKVRGRIEQAIGAADVAGVARKFLNPEAKKATAQSLRREGLDDGVRL